METSSPNPVLVTEPFEYEIKFMKLLLHKHVLYKISRVSEVLLTPVIDPELEDFYGKDINCGL